MKQQLSSDRSHFLHFSPISPAPYGNGLAMRASMFSEALARLGNVDVVIMARGQTASATWQFDGIRFHSIPADQHLDTRLQLINLLEDVAERSAALRDYGRPSASAILSAPVLKRAGDICQNETYAGIFISRSYLLPLLDSLPREARRLPVFVDLDDDDAALYREWASRERSRGFIERADWLDAESDVFDGLIQSYASRVSLFICASDIVTRSLSSRLQFGDIETIPNGVDTSWLKEPRANSNNLIFVGNLSYKPNVDGLLWFVSDVWPIILENARDAHLIVVGSLPDHLVRNACNAPGISLFENPESLEQLYDNASLAIIPLRSGSGSRIKILEAAVFGLPIVSTRKGAEGLDLELTENMTVCPEDAGAFAAACLNVQENRQSAVRQASFLQRSIKKLHDRDEIVRKISQLLAAAIQSASHGAGVGNRRSNQPLITD